MGIKIIYIVCPTDTVSGGVNSLHILCQALVQNNFNAQMYYLGNHPQFFKNPIIQNFNVPYSDTLVDNESSLIIVPETLTTFFGNYVLAQKMVYWLGIYFFFKTPPHRFPLNFKPIRKIFQCSSYYGQSKNFFHQLAKKVNYWNKAAIPIWNSTTFHMSNSFYVADFIKSKGLEYVWVLHNPVRKEFYEFAPSPEREKCIIFGPKTSSGLIRFVNKKFPGFSCVRLKGLSAQQTIDFYRKSILFIELGSFSGRDRMPREAVLSGCVILTSRSGSAAFYQDLQLDNYYKIDTYKSYKSTLISKINDIVNDYNSHYSNMNTYLNYLKFEYAQFNNTTKEVFEKVQLL
jgi:hypothetical protein